MMTKGGPVTSLSRRSYTKKEREEAQAERGDSKDFMAEFIAFNKQQMQMRLQEVMERSVDRMVDRQNSAPPAVQYQQAPPPQYQQAPPAWYQQQQAPPPPPPQQWAPPPQQPPPQQPQSVVPPRLPVEEPRNSSPIDPEAQEESLVGAFFDWKLERIADGPSHEKLAEIKELFLTKWWTESDMRDMVNPTHRMYRIAMDAGVPDGMARRFGRDLTEFKKQWRHAKTLLAFRGQQ